MRILTLDTSTDNCLVVLTRDNEVFSTSSTGSRSHARHLLPMIEKLARECGQRLEDLDALAVVTGPGSFTGIRIGVGAVQGLALALDKPVLTISTLEALANASAGVEKAAYILALMSARTSEFYAGLFEVGAGGSISPSMEKLLQGNQVLDLVAGYDVARICAVGEGWMDKQYFSQELLDSFTALETAVQIDDRTLGALACRKWLRQEFTTAQATLPNYLKENMQYRQTDQDSTSA